MFLSFPPSFTDHPFANSYITRAFTILLSTFCLVLAWKDNANAHISHITHCWVIQPPNNCWIYHNASDHKVLLITNFFLISDASVSLEKHIPSILCQTPQPWGSIFLSLVNNSKSAETYIQALYKERDTRQG